VADARDAACDVASIEPSVAAKRRAVPYSVPLHTIPESLLLTQGGVRSQKDGRGGGGEGI